MDGRERIRGIRWTLWWVLIANLAVAAGKAVYGWYSGSVSITSDAIHSALDSSSNVIGLIGLSFSAAPADTGHPYGHRKFEILASALIGVLIFAGGYEVGRTSIESLLQHHPGPHIGWGGFAVVLATIATNFVVSRAERRTGERLQSPFLIADAQHTASDMLVSLTVLVAFIATRAGLRWADPAGALLVLVLIVRVGWRVLRENVQVLVDAAVVDPDRIQKLASSVKGVESIHRVRSRGAPGSVHVDLHMQVDPALTVATAHAIAHQVEDLLRAELHDIIDVTIHIEPSGDPEESI
jgi:cation diffusion facilitator family transporter